ncbi:MAG: hypothetical protein [Inoviridae sp.]|nr:MAG: hypothetical protein [Inoviridae sp.]
MKKDKIKLADAKKLAFGINHINIHSYQYNVWVVYIEFQITNHDYQDDYIALETFRGEVRLFNTADAAIKAARSITESCEITVTFQPKAD